MQADAAMCLLRSLAPGGELTPDTLSSGTGQASAGNSVCFGVRTLQFGRVGLRGREWAPGPTSPGGSARPLPTLAYYPPSPPTRA